MLDFFSELFNIHVADLESDNFIRQDIEDDESDNNKRLNLLKTKILRIRSLFNTIYFIYFDGKKKTPLQVMIGSSVQSTCKCSTLIKKLNRLGVSVSYDEIQRSQTRLANFVISNSQDNVQIPIYFHKQIFTIAAFDNFDHNGTTTSGLDGVHDTVTVLFQDKSSQIIKKPKISETNVPKRDRTFKNALPCQNLQEYDHPSGPIKIPDEFNVQYSASEISLENYNELSIDDLTWTLCRMDLSALPDEISKLNGTQYIPSWSAFHSTLTADKRPVTSVGFPPILPHSVKDNSTVYTCMRNFNNILQQLDQNSLPVFCDQDVYRVARDIKLKNPDEFKNLCIFMGNFHFIKCSLAAIGKYLKNSGVENLLVETEAFGPGVAEQVLNGTNYARSLKAFVLISETLKRLQLEAFFNSSTLDDFQDELDSLSLLEEVIIEKDFDTARVLFRDILKKPSGLKIAFENFIKSRCAESSLFHYWNNVLIMIGIVKDLIRSDCSGDWNLYVKSVKKMLPIFHVLDRTNYGRWGSLYLQDLLLLSNSHPDVYEEFLEGKFTVKLTNHSFSSIAPDQGLKTTINRLHKSGCGIIGSAKQVEYVTRWDLTFHEQLAIDNYLRGVTFLREDNYELQMHHDISTSITGQNEELITKMIHFLNNKVNPFSPEQNVLINICTKELYPSENVAAVISLFDTGCAIYKKFCEERFFTRKNRKNLSDTMKQVKLSLVDTKSKEVTVNKNESGSKLEKEAQRMIELARERKYNLEKLFSYELTFSNPLFGEDGFFVEDKNKYALIDTLNAKISTNEPTRSVGFSALIIDVMILSRKAKWKQLQKKTFKFLALECLQIIKKSLPNEVNRIDLIQESFAYNFAHIKSSFLRSESESILLYQITDETDSPMQEKKFWSSTANCLLFQTYVCNFILANKNLIRKNIEIVISAVNDQQCLVSNSLQNFSILTTLSRQDINQVDQRKIIHIDHCVKENHLVIKTIGENCDCVAMMLFYWTDWNQKGLQELWFEYSCGVNNKIVAIHVLANHFDKTVLQVIPAMHNLTGSSFTSKIGTKQSALANDPAKFLSTFGTDPDLITAIAAAEIFLIKVIKKTTSCITLDSLRYQEYHHGSTFNVSELPPTSASLHQHILRAWFITYQQIYLLDNYNYSRLNPLLFGYELLGDVIVPKKIRDLYPPLDELVPCCSCQKCSTKACRCVRYNLPCTTFCTCQTTGSCANVQ